MSASERLWSKVRCGAPDECWLWTGTVASSGYGSPISGQSPHRVAYESKFGSIPSKHVIDHVCHNAAALRGDCGGGTSCTHRLCCNPRHLRAVSHGENLAASPHTPNGRERKRCGASGCDRHSDRASGFCHTHHNRWMKFGDPNVMSPRMNRPPVCSVDGCDDVHRANGYCSVHAARVRRYGDPHEVRQLQTSNRPTVCVVDGCIRPHRARGFCSSHWNRWRRHGDPTVGGLERELAAYGRAGPDVDGAR